MTLQLRERERQDSLRWLGLLTVITIIVWHSPLAIALYPFMLLATWFHEMGHGLAGMLVGARFETLVILPDGSGYTETLRPVDMSRIESAVISAGGPLGPAIAGGALIVASRWRKGSTAALVVLAATLLASTLLVVRGPTGLIAMPLIAFAILALARFAGTARRQIALQFLGLQACISTYVNLGYLFSKGGVLEGGAMLSDTAQMARALLLPYWFWGGALTLAILGIIAASLWLAYRR